MLRNVYAPSDFFSGDADPGVSSAEKLRRIAAAPVIATPFTRPGWGVIDHDFTVTLPYVRGGQFDYWDPCGMKDLPNRLQAAFVDVGDRELYGHGIGSRLVRAAVRYALDRSPNITTFATGIAKLGMLNTVAKVFGQDSVTATLHSGVRYGGDAERPLEALFDDNPGMTSERFPLQTVAARIDVITAMGWEEPVYQRLPLSE